MISNISLKFLRKFVHFNDYFYKYKFNESLKNYRTEEFNVNAESINKTEKEFIRNNLTVIITIRNRRNTLPRIINYYADFPAKVIFLDSTKSAPYENQSQISPNIYSYVPDKSYIEKIYECTLKIKTKYSVVICDDDFLSSSCLYECIKYLDNNSNCVSVRGQEIALFDNFLSYESIDYLLDLKANSNENKPLERINKILLSNYGMSPHSIMRNSDQIRIQEFHLKYSQFNSINFYDVTLSLLLAFKGNSKVLPTFYMIRSSETKAKSFKLSKEIINEISDWKPELSFENDFLKQDTTPLEKIANITRKQLENIHSNCINRQIKESLFMSILSKQKLAPKHFPGLFKYSIDKYKIYFRYGSGGNLIGASGWRSKFKGGLNHDELVDIYPVLKPTSLSSIRKMIKFVIDFPL